MIDEKKLIKRLESMQEKCNTLQERLFFYGILAIADAQPKVGEWIPVSERLPEEPGTYRVTCLYDDKWYRVKDDLFYSDRTWGYDIIHRNRKVIAWKPLEEPYEEKENE